MSENDINSDKTTFKIRISGEGYHDIVVDWTDTSGPYSQQVFLQLEAYLGIPVKRILTWSWRLDEECVTFNNPEYFGDCPYNGPVLTKEKLTKLMGEDQYFGFSFDMICIRDQNSYLTCCVVSERIMDETRCTRHFCHHTDTRAFLNQLKAIITNDALTSQMKPLLVDSRFPYGYYMREAVEDPWSRVFRQFNVLQFYERRCCFYEQLAREAIYNMPYVIYRLAPQLYLRHRG